MSNQNSPFKNTMTNRGGARPMKVVVDGHGNEWICDSDADAKGGFESDGCWRTDQMAFDRNF